MARPRKDDKRGRILQAAVKVFARKGYFAARVSEIAKKAGVADGTIYLYFRSKEDLLVSLFDEVMAAHLEAARHEMKAAPGPAARLLRMAEHHLRALGENRDLAVVFQVELRQSTKFMERFTASWLQEYFQLLYGVIEEGQRAGVFRADLEKKLVAKAIFGALDEMVTSFILSGKDYDLAGLAAPVVDLFLRGVAVPGKVAHTRPVLAAAGAGRGGK
ncbi:MAG TPA: TetR/AcrR family transcriptional regulator [Vicinamibacteria bacterium]|jgi:TetR/AcrR family fatty acid metabolism transcriptional regulator